MPRPTVNRDRLYERLGERIRHERLRCGLRQVELAKFVDLSRTSITNIECGRQAIYAHQLVEFALALEVDPSDLLPPPSEVRDDEQPIYSAELLELVSKLKRAAG